MKWFFITPALIAFCSLNANAAVMFSVVDNEDYNGSGGTFSIQLSGDETISAFDLQLGFGAFSGASQAGGSLTINSAPATSGGAFFFPQPGNEGTKTVSEGGALQQNSFIWNTTLTATPTTFATFTYTGNGGVFPEDNTFTVSILPQGAPTDTIGTEVQNNGDILAFTSTAGVIGRVTAIPEPGSMALCGMLAAGAGAFRLRRRRAA